MSQEENDSQKVINVDIEKEMQKSFLDYSMSVIVSRALPDVRDGLKPVHRRILYTMFENSLGPDKPYRKCADTVGAVLARYHPHGDAGAYDALVRLAQNFSMRYMLVDGHGNFGSIDGDPPAAYRYTEARMSKIAVKMLTDIDKETVNFRPNYDDRLREPEVLPSRFPNFIVNGSTGIAVGMAANIPPHNLGEVIDGVCYLIDNPNATLDELMNHIKGPDFPTGAMIMGYSGIREAYAKGRGKIIIRAKTEIIEDKGSGRSKIVVTELPYQVNKAKLCESIAELVKDKRIDGISNIEDHSDRNGMHMEITIKRSVSPQTVLNQLYSYTQLQSTFGVIMLAIVNGEPKILTLKDALKHYLDFQVEIITKRTIFILRKAKERAHILEGLMIALDFIDEVIALLRSSKTIGEGKERLMDRFKLDAIQAQAIVQMRLGQLTNLERTKIEEELDALSKEIADFEDILQNGERLLGILKEEILAVRAQFADARRTQIQTISGEVDIEDLIPEEESVLTLTNLGYVKRQKPDIYKLQRRGGRGVSGMTTREEDFASDIFAINTHDYILFFTNFGRVYRLKCYEIPEGSRIAKGVNIANLLQISGKEKITALIRVPKFEDEKYLTMVTKRGLIKRTALKDYKKVQKNGKIALTLDEGDELAWVKMTNGSQELIIATKKGYAMRFSEEDVRVVGRHARGVRALRLREKDSVVGIDTLKEDTFVLTVSETGFGRISPINNYRLQARGGKGITNYHVAQYGDVAAIRAVNLQDDVIMISSEGVIIRIQAKSIRACARPSKGVKLMRVGKDNKIVTLTCTPHEDEPAFDGNEVQILENMIENMEEEDVQELEKLEPLF
ncbi:MAG: DNA gyrase subunit A [Oscillospiraceae bacterium]|nr:DNA gyrase subunit A [Oscillospiraceae bacterium]